MASEPDMTNKTMTPNRTPMRMTPVERAMGRLMRAPDHSASEGAGAGDSVGAAVAGGDGAAPAGVGAEGVGEGAAANAGSGDGGTILGGEGAGAAASVAEAGEGSQEGAPEAYELAAPDGFTLDAESIELATPVFKELNLTNDQANKLMPVAAQFAERIQQQGQQAIMGEVTAQRRAWAEEAQNDPDIGGAKWQETQALAAKALDGLGYPKGSTFRSFLTDSGLGNHPEMIRAMRKIGELVGEDGDFVRGDKGAQVKKSREEILYPAS